MDEAAYVMRVELLVGKLATEYHPERRLEILESWLAEVGQALHAGYSGLDEGQMADFRRKARQSFIASRVDAELLPRGLCHLWGLIREMRGGNAKEKQEIEQAKQAAANAASAPADGSGEIAALRRENEELKKAMEAQNKAINDKLELLLKGQTE